MPASSRPRILLLRPLRILLGAALGLAAAESLGRTIVVDRNWAPQAGISATQLDLPMTDLFRTAPGLSVRVGAWGRRTWGLHTDAMGFRVPAPEVTRVAADAAYERVLVVGASYSFGLEVEAEESWPYRVEEILGSEDIPVRIINASQPGYSLPEMLRTLETLPHDLAVDRVLLVLPRVGPYMLGLGEELNDEQHRGSFPYSVLMGPLIQAADRRTELERRHDMVVRSERPLRSPLWDALTLGTFVGHRTAIRCDLGLGSGRTRARGEDEPIDVERYLAIVRSLGERARTLAAGFQARDVAMHLLILPVGLPNRARAFDRVGGRLQAEFARTAGLLERRIDKVDFSAATPLKIELEKGHGRDFLEHDDHLSVRGHRRVAEKVAAWYKLAAAARIRAERRKRG